MVQRFDLAVSYAEKDQAKRLGAKFDWQTKRWYVLAEPDYDLSAFARWQPQPVLAGDDFALAPIAEGPQADSAALRVARGALTEPGAAMQGYATALAAPSGVSLAQLMQRVAAAVDGVAPDGVWVIVELAQLRVNRGHLYLELTERDAAGRQLAAARGVIWQSVAERILPQFERLTGTVLGAGQKLLLRARAQVHLQYGLSLHIDGIDANYTLGELAARRREIRARLQKEGLADLNRALAAPWDFQRVLVLAPADGAGLGDFRKEAERLQEFGLCQFDYAYARFQGNGAAHEIVLAMHAALADMPAPDAVVLIRGGGAALDLAWLDDYELARAICELPIAVFTGIGHERDSTLLDEVAHTSFDTPSKVIAGIERAIARRARAARQFALDIFAGSRGHLQECRGSLLREREQILAGARLSLAQSRARVASASQQISAAAALQLRLSRELVKDLQRQISTAGKASLQQAAQSSAQNFQAICQNASGASRVGALRAAELQRELAQQARLHVERARANSQALLREIIGQGPEKTLARGFVMVKNSRQQAVTSAANARGELALHFQDGVIQARASDDLG